MRWRIGSGVNIKILGQPWLLEDNNPYITTRSPAIDNQTVSSLFCTDRKEWEVDIIKDVFNERDQQSILNIRLDDSSTVDELYWRLENTGIYSVKSAYKLLQMQGGNWHTDDNSSVWRELWRIKAPPRALNLVWRAMSNCLPTLTQLQYKHVSVQSWCPVCTEEAETIMHCLVSCQFAKQCWEILNLNVSYDQNTEFKTWIEERFKSGTDKQRAESVTLCWAIWRARNDLVWNQKSSTVNRVVASAKQSLTQWNLAQSRSYNTHLQPQVKGDGVSYWVKPQPNTVKVSVDAAIFEDREEVGFGLVARDSDGSLIEAKAMVQKELVEPVLAEAMGVKEALSWIEQMQ